MRPLFIFFLKWRIKRRLGKEVPSKWVLSPGAIFCIVHKVKIRRKKTKTKNKKTHKTSNKLRYILYSNNFFLPGRLGLWRRPGVGEHSFWG